ncbi:MAG TPA: retroviral-like aspartic protease family protein [Caulobacteraceae bacterium]|jgi:predicted aspartyl protease
MRKLVVATGLALTLACVAAGAADADCQIAQVAEFHPDFTDGSPVIDGEINGQPARMVIDSGSDLSIVTMSAVGRLGLVATGLIGGQVYGVGGGTQLGVTTLKELKVGGQTEHNLTVAVGADPGGRLPYDMLLGEDMLSQFDVEFDFPDGAIRLMRTKDCQPAQLVYWNKPYAMAPLREEMHTDVMLNGHRVTAQIDSGASETTVGGVAAEAVGALPATTGETAVGVGPKEVTTKSATFATFALGQEQIQRARLTIQGFRHGMTYTETGTNLPKQIEGTPSMLLGDDFLRAHRVFVSNAAHTIVFSYVGGPVFAPLPDDAPTAADAKPPPQ